MALADRPTPPTQRSVVPTSPGRLRPGVNLDDSAALRDLLEDGE